MLTQSQLELHDDWLLTEAEDILTRIHSSDAIATVYERLLDLAPAAEPDVMYFWDQKSLADLLRDQRRLREPILTIGPMSKFNGVLLRTLESTAPSARAQDLGHLRWLFTFTCRFWGDDALDDLDKRGLIELVTASPTDFRSAWAYARRKKLVHPSTYSSVYEIGHTVYPRSHADEIVREIYRSAASYQAPWGELRFLGWPGKKPARYRQLCYEMERATRDVFASKADTAKYIEELSIYRKSELYARRAFEAAFGVEIGIGPQKASEYWLKHDLVPERAKSGVTDHARSVQTVVLRENAKYRDSLWVRQAKPEELG